MNKKQIFSDIARGKKTYEVDTDDLDDMDDDDEVKDTDPIRWKYHQMGQWDSKMILNLGIKFAQDFDGKEVNEEEFMQMVGEDLDKNPTGDAEKRYGSYVTLLRVYGIGRTTGDPKRFEASNACKFFLGKKKNPKEFLLNHLMIWQYPNATSNKKWYEEGVKILPFPLTLKVLILLSEKSPAHAFLTKGELLTVVSQAQRMGKEEDLVEQILAKREKNTSYADYLSSSKFKEFWADKKKTEKHWDQLRRMTVSFCGTGLMKREGTGDDYKLTLEQDSIAEAKNILLIHKYEIYKWSDKDDWDKHHGAN
jgi:hypothetical protein